MRLGVWQRFYYARPDSAVKAGFFDLTYGHSRLRSQAEYLHLDTLLILILKVDAALKALEIDDSLAEAHSSLGIVRLYYEWDWSGAEAALRRALELNPNYAWGHAFWSEWLLIMGRHKEAITEAQLGKELDPLSASLIFNVGKKLCCMRAFDRALEQLQEALELDPNFVWAHTYLAQICAWKGRYEESLVACEKVARLLGATNTAEHCADRF